MAYSKSARRAAPPGYRKEIYGVLFFSLGFFISLCLFSYNATDPGFNTASSTQKIANLGGMVGAYLADLLFTTLGLCAYVVAALSFLISTLKFKGHSFEIRVKEILYYLLLLASVATLLQLHFPIIRISGQNFAGGGVLGSLFSQFMVLYLNKAGAEIVAITVLLLSFVLATELKISALAVNAWRLSKYFGIRFSRWAVVSFERSKVWMGGQWKSIFARTEDQRPKTEDTEEEEEIEEDEEEEDEEEEAEKIVNKPVSDDIKIYERADAGKKPSPEEQLHFLRISSGSFTIPPISLLDSDQQKSIKIDEDILKKNAQLLDKKLKDYDVEGHVTEIHPGPVITMYEYEPAPGVKVNKIVNLESDLSLAMGGKSIRIVAHLPGKAALGIEIPNHEREIVWLKEIIGSNVFQKTKSKLCLALGKDIEGRPMVTDLTKMPHLLI
ncbi:MAG: DNA translocase FtsK 4TM domain-containing protein, partial [bacterium]|nr:DNA translocase FtsK 4TM domain-containing protein [bacterium]